MYIHLRLTEITAIDQQFGALNLVIFGDLNQIPPVKGNQPFQTMTLQEAKQQLGAVSSLDLWGCIEYDELTINMRWNGDAIYANLLSLMLDNVQ